MVASRNGRLGSDPAKRRCRKVGFNRLRVCSDPPCSFVLLELLFSQGNVCFFAGRRLEKQRKVVAAALEGCARFTPRFDSAGGSRWLSLLATA